LVGRRKKSDAELVLALACGASPDGAAQKTGLSLRTVYRRLAEPAFRARIRDARSDMAQRTAGMLTAASVGALKTLTFLQESATSQSVRLAAARTVLELGCKFREAVDLNERLTALESRLEDVLTGWPEGPVEQ
jgi:hypothetical protein